MLGLTILFEGQVPTASELQTMVNDCPFIEDVCATVIEDNKDIAKRIVLSVIDDKKTDMSKGDAAVTVLSAAVSDMSNDCQFVSDIFNIIRSKNAAALRACKVLAKDAHVSDKIANAYGFNEDKRRVIKQLLTNV